MPVAHLNSRALIDLTGPDTRSFLNNLLTQEVSQLADGRLAFGALLSPQGRLLFDLFIVGTAQGVRLDCAATRRDLLVQRLRMYRLRASVEITPIDAPVMVAWGDNSMRDWPADPRLDGLGRRWLGDADHSADMDEDDWRSHQLALGVPDPGLDCRMDADYPIECNFDLLNGMDFAKGCFIGQETSSRMKRRGTVKTRLVPLRIDGSVPPPGTEILNGDLRAGEVRSGVGAHAMGLMRLDRLAGELRIGDRSAQAEPPAWLGLSA